MMRSLCTLASLLFVIGTAHAQSTITLDDFDLGSEPAKASEMETCLADRANCKNAEFKSSATFSIDDVVALGIVDREEVKVEPASTGSGGQTSTDPLPSIDMEILFDYDSDRLRPDQYGKLGELSKLLKGGKFADYRFAFLGHSDAKGSQAYNQDLSFRRAQAVSSLVAQMAGIQPTRMIASGMGKSQLKTPGDPFGQANRRVQLVLIPVK